MKKKIQQTKKQIVFIFSAVEATVVQCQTQEILQIQITNTNTNTNDQANQIQISINTNTNKKVHRPKSWLP